MYATVTNIRPQFPEGVSGYSLSDTDAVIWTRIAPWGRRQVVVQWEVFADDSIEPLRSGLALADARNEFAVRVVLTGLAPGGYRFRFSVDPEDSPPGELWLNPGLSAPAVRACPAYHPIRSHRRAGPSAHG